ncbi:hypothetical protein F5Y15DRAFT_368635 [Xylariaceae sp. FL0016]|nr:hypothetical protein F5Y15DRAFT_368635 [Xylariaceae sp. FL0016]
MRCVAAWGFLIHLRNAHPPRPCRVRNAIMLANQDNEESDHKDHGFGVFDPCSTICQHQTFQNYYNSRQYFPHSPYPSPHIGAY